MTAQRIGVFTIAFPDPYAINYDNNKFTTLNNSLSFQYRILSNIQTLSTKDVDASTDPYGILYVPDLHTDECKDQEQQYVAANATRIANLPPAKNYALIAVAPWYSPQCTIEYFTAARQAPTKAIFVYQPNKGNAEPPVLNDPSWNLQDGGAWQKANTFPTYALTSYTGDNIIDQLALYSGNVSKVPYGDQLSQLFDPTDYIRLWATVSTDSGPRLPSLWVFLVIVLSILIVAVTGTSISMHIIQRRRRNDLHRRVIAGEVDLEALGVKRLNISQQTLDKLPLYTYTLASNDSEKHQTPLSPPPETGAKTPPAGSSSMPSATAASSASWNQPTCPICLDDFEPNETQVRELPCRHIFHPDCIDTFLLRNSSLCPMCKQSVLPAGVCPVTITNMMVRRERHIIRMHSRGVHPTSPQADVSSGALLAQSSNPPPGLLASLAQRIRGALPGQRIVTTPERASTRPPDIEMANNTIPAHGAAGPAQGNSPEHPLPHPVPPTPTQDCSPSQNRREWARQRALALLGNRQAPASDMDQVDTQPRWRHALQKVFPGYR